MKYANALATVTEMTFKLLWESSTALQELRVITGFAFSKEKQG